ncbi:hypothetical protein Ait01nite_064140 [Actinoplanes italicus]|uniref:Uncharacterized protein n=1 Tax=Actinoplanes italicus TaxID=113567 RepID=A0A2T0K5A7_9ACTN|nr:hypothetical protein [Actinoplanes italicus]PRX17851.1 hypothetical protein CLV67_11420 [Actinoplanes italicus]GIE33369.1 hypothetical protein Ait01nite_064140 [Actinoplanes italicus]
MRDAEETPGDSSGAGLGARLVALGGLELGQFDPAPAAAPAGPDAGRARDRRRRVISALVAVAVVACFGTAAYLFVSVGGSTPPAVSAPPRKPAPSFSGADAAGPRPADHGVRAEDDLHLVCDDRFYPSAPRARGGVPHPVLISERAAGTDYRTSRTLNQAAYAGSATQRRMWAPEPAKAQLVACLDLTGSGRAIRDCRSGAETRKLVEGRYLLTVYEVATRRKVAERPLTGTDRTCPFVILSSAGDTLYSAVEDQQLFEQLRKRVEG